MGGISDQGKPLVDPSIQVLHIQKLPDLEFRRLYFGHELQKSWLEVLVHSEKLINVPSLVPLCAWC
jgi:hypothetical protein